MGEEYNFLWARLYQTMILHLVVSRSSLQRVLTPRGLCIQIIKLRLSCLKTYLFLIRLTWANLLVSSDTFFKSDGFLNTRGACQCGPS